MYKSKIFQFIAVLIILSESLFADNEFIIESFKSLPNDMAGSVYAKQDANNEFCGLIKVRTGIREELAFDSGLKFSPSEKKNPGEYWVYVSPGEGRLTLMAEGFIPKHFQISSVKIESKQTYELIVKEKEENKIPISIIVEPEDAEKWLDEDSLGTNVNFKVKPGNYKLTIKKEGYKDYENDITINEDKTLFKDIVLISLFDSTLADQNSKVHWGVGSSAYGYTGSILLLKGNKGNRFSASYGAAEGINMLLTSYTYEIHNKIKIGENEGLSWFYGAGTNIGYAWGADNAFLLGTNVVVGIEYQFKTLPLYISIYYKPTVYVLPGFFVIWNAFGITI